MLVLFTGSFVNIITIASSIAISFQPYHHHPSHHSWHMLIFVMVPSPSSIIIIIFFFIFVVIAPARSSRQTSVSMPEHHRSCHGVFCMM